MKDTPYCGVREDVIETSSPTFIEGRREQFSYYVNERLAVQQKKESGLSAPWTEDRILRDFRFTNVSRRDDRVSRWFIENIAERDDLATEAKVYNTFLFRAFNKTETAEGLMLPFKKNGEKYLRGLIADMRASGYDKHFGTAYFQSGLKGAWKTDDDTSNRMVDMVEWLIANDYYSKVTAASNQKECFETIKEVAGFAEFLAYQVFVDLTYIPEFPFTDKEFTVSGPGCHKGINCLFDERDGMTDEECIFWIRDNQELFGLTTDVSVMDIENCFCEFSKFIGIQLNPKKRMRKYY